ncbi:acyl-CoA dehydrogenase family protein [Cryptosporangium sp. NPDC048952]|uniref:acyl-CoA dehydrogenase family protein n=1 Tax=Cryptosporangium sp. NPDC048952 TaxID=3363961 RepID=UPI003718074C
MDFELSDEQTMLREVSRTMLADRRDQDLWRRGVELGWIGLAVPEEFGGVEQGLVELCLVAEELGRAVAPGPIAESALVALIAARGPGGPSAPTARNGAREASAPAAGRGDGKLAAALAAGDVRASLAVSGAVSATRGSDVLTLDGRLTAVQSADDVDWLLVTADLAGTPTLILVEAGLADARRLLTLDETRAWYEVTLTGVRVPVAQILGDAEWLLAAAAVLTAADALGAGERLLEGTVEHVKTREQFGKPLGTFQSVKHKAADMLISIKGARAAIYYAAMALDAGAPDGVLAASVAKAYTSEAMSRLAGEALQTHGGVGFTWEHDLHLYLRRLKVDEVLHGTPSDHHERIVSLLA